MIAPVEIDVTNVLMIPEKDHFVNVRPDIMKKQDNNKFVEV